MSRDAWFDQYERLYNEREAGEMEGEVTDEDLSERATEALVDQMGDRADMLNDEKWERQYAARRIKG